jgi:hypothetical protein
MMDVPRFGSLPGLPTRELREFDPQTQADIWTLSLEDAESDHPKVGKPEPFLVTTFDERAPMILPDGRWLAYEANGRSRLEAVTGLSGRGSVRESDEKKP